MSYYLRFVVTESKDVTFDDIRYAMTSASSRYSVDGDTILYDWQQCAIVEINHRGDGVMEPDIDLLCRFARKKRNKSRLVNMLQSATTMITVQPLWQGDQEGVSQQMLAPLWKWLWGNREGLLAIEGGTFCDANGPVR